MTQQLELNLEGLSSPTDACDLPGAEPARTLAVVLPFRRPVVFAEDTVAREDEACVQADLDLIRLFM